MRSFESTLRYLDGNCSWEATAPGLFEDVFVGKSQEIIVAGGDTADGLIWKCLVDGAIKLNAVFSVYGNTVLYSFITFRLIVLFARY